MKGKLAKVLKMKQDSCTSTAVGCQVSLKGVVAGSHDLPLYTSNLAVIRVVSSTISDWRLEKIT